jgi:hypothetical protein
VSSGPTALSSRNMTSRYVRGIDMSGVLGAQWAGTTEALVTPPVAPTPTGSVNYRPAAQWILPSNWVHHSPTGLTLRRGQ